MQTIYLENGSVLELSRENGLVIRGSRSNYYFKTNGESDLYMIFEDMLNINANYAINPNMFTDEEIADYIRDKITENNLKGLTKVRELIDKSVETRTLVTLVREQYRGFGKSYALAMKAKELGATLIVPHHLVRDYLQWIPKKQVKSYSTVELAKGARFQNGFLVDEGVGLAVIKELSRDNEFLGGFGRL